MSGKVYSLAGPQRDAVDPRESVWLSASAGTGKTQVLSARVLRLLLQPDVHPSQILCLTFTKAGAAEMAVRVNEVLARWVRLDEASLAEELGNIGAKIDAETRERARTRFAAVLDCPGGGLRIDTIHAFSQWLLAAFPEEAGLVPGTRPMEDRDRELLAHEVLAELLVDAEAADDDATLDALAELSRRKGEDAARHFLMRCAQAERLWVGTGAWTPPLRPRVNQLLGLAADADAADVAALCAEDAFDVAAVRACMEIDRQWAAKTGQGNADRAAAWLAASPETRASSIGELASIYLTAAGDPRSYKSQEKIDPAYGSHAAAIIAAVEQVLDKKRRLELAEWLAPALTLGRRFALAWRDAKAREGLIDFDDQIRLAAELLSRKDSSDWIRYKLDRQFDHILIDEAQDTNREQWAIIFALIDDFFSGEGAHGDRLRTIFTVGDYKQAIFGFQGTSPDNFESARQRVKREMEAAARGAREMRGGPDRRPLREYGLGRSFRSAQPVLTFVDEAIAAIGYEAFGLESRPEPHVGEDLPGIVAMWKPVDTARDEESVGDEETGWISRPDRQLADRIARQVRRWTQGADRLVLTKGYEREAEPGDVMVLVRKRKELAGLIVARLHAHGVPVAGIDRLRLAAPLAVQDLMAALRFAAQPRDDLNLAGLLVSPLIGWSQQELLDHGYRAENVRLWDQLRRSRHPKVAETVARLGDLLARADFDPPHALLYWLLVGPWRARQGLVARLGLEANDPIDELVNAAFAYSSAHTPSLAGFIQWFDAGEGELKREADGGAGQVRVMTVHGAKGLQAPIVILADAADDPDRSMPRALDLTEEMHEGLGEFSAPRTVPLPGLRKEDKAGPIAAAETQAALEERQEHWRLLYVALTRAEEALFIAGSLGSRDNGEPAPDSWYARLEPLFGEALDDPLWGVRRERGALKAATAAVAKQTIPERVPELPEWAVIPIGPEPRPPRPLAPSDAGEDLAPDPPAPPGTLRDAARRGVLVHALLERLPDVAEAEREQAALAWLARRAADLPDAGRAEMAQSALAVLGEPAWADIFTGQALAEVPLMATVEGRVIAGTADRVLVEEDRVLVVDYKTARRPPESLADMPPVTLRQMAAYVAALEKIYPGRAVEAAVLYTSAPRLIAIPADEIARHKQALGAAEESFST